MVLVFKTSVQNREDVVLLAPALDVLAGKGQWNFALDDCDRILRIVSQTIGPEIAIQMLAYHGFDCEELEDIVPGEKFFYTSLPDDQAGLRLNKVNL